MRTQLIVTSRQVQPALGSCQGNRLVATQIGTSCVRRWNARPNDKILEHEEVDHVKLNRNWILSMQPSLQQKCKRVSIDPWLQLELDQRLEVPHYEEDSHPHWSPVQSSLFGCQPRWSNFGDWSWRRDTTFLECVP